MLSVVGTRVKEVCSSSLITDGWLDKARHLMGMFYKKAGHYRRMDI
jgi:regulator of sigma D